MRIIIKKFCEFPSRHFARMFISLQVYALLIYPGRVFFKETYMKEEVEKEENKRNCNCLQFLRKCCKNDEEEQNVSADETELMMISEGLKEKNVLMKHDRSISYSNGLERCEGFELSPQRHRSYSLQLNQSKVLKYYNKNFLLESNACKMFNGPKAY